MATATAEDLDLKFDDVPRLLEELKDHELVKNALKILSEGDLANYSAKARTEIQDLEADSLQEYMGSGRAQQILDLHEDIKRTDSVLSTMSDMLSGFQEEMGVLSSQIQTLLDDSVSMKARLTNREAVEVELEHLTHHVVIDEDLVNGVFNTPINESYIKFLVKMDKIGAFIKSIKMIEGDYVRGLKDVEPILARLQLKAVARIREFLLQKIYALQKPQTNIQIIQQSSLLRYKQLYKTMFEWNIEVAVEVKNIYVEVLSQLITANFKLYVNSLLKRKMEDATRYDLLALAEAVKSRSGGMFALGDRGLNIIEGDFDAVNSLIPHIAAMENKKFYFERIYLSIHRVLLDTVSCEVLFEREFFSFDLFKQVFADMIEICEETIDTYVGASYDCIALSLMLIIVEQDIEIMRRRSLSVLDPYLAKSTNKILTRLLFLLDANIQSLKAAQPKDMGIVDTRPHIITRRYSEFIVAMSILGSQMSNQINSARLTPKMKLLCSQMKDLLMRISLLEADDLKRSIFLLNNYDLILNVLKERNLEVAAPEGGDFREMFNVESVNCVELKLLQHFNGLINFVKKKTQAPDTKVTNDAISNFIRQFAASWKDVLKRLSSDMMTSFSNFTTGSQILNKAFAQLVLYYKRFEEVIKTQHKEAYAMYNSDFVPVSTITYEMRQLTADFS